MAFVQFGLDRMMRLGFGSGAKKADSWFHFVVRFDGTVSLFAIARAITL